MTGDEGAEHSAPRSLDLVYIEALRDCAAVKQDIENWIGGGRPGGVIEAMNTSTGSQRVGVQREVGGEGFTARGLRVNATF